MMIPQVALVLVSTLTVKLISKRIQLYLSKQSSEISQKIYLS